MFAEFLFERFAELPRKFLGAGDEEFDTLELFRFSSFQVASEKCRCGDQKRHTMLLH